MSGEIVTLPRAPLGRCHGCGMYLGPAEVVLIRPDGFLATMCPGCYQYGGIPGRAPFTWDGDSWLPSLSPTNETTARPPPLGVKVLLKSLAV